MSTHPFPQHPSFSPHLCNEVEGEWREEEQGRWKMRLKLGGGGAGCVGLHVSWPSVAGVSLALGRSESVSRLDMRSSSACTSPRPSFEPVSNVGRHRDINNWY